ncbi:MAG: hypothetical protein CBB60_003035 [Armatimonadetes bacterium Cent15-Ar3]|nr:MAG: hypothetical protein CBB60_003035 [Armatimonadetes bacterium Cent15-Ar3]
MSEWVCIVCSTANSEQASLCTKCRSHPPAPPSAPKEGGSISNPPDIPAVATVKWFSREKGYGFLYRESGQDLFFRVEDIDGPNLPSEGDTVSFREVLGSKGPRAKQVQFRSRGLHATNSGDDRIQCRSCSRKMVPRIITGPPLDATNHWTPVPKHSVCPYCGATHQEFPPTDSELNNRRLQTIIVVIASGPFLIFWLKSWFRF